MKKETRDKMISYQLWLTPDEHKFIKTAAAANGISLKTAFIKGAKLLFKQYNERLSDIIE